MPALKFRKSSIKKISGSAESKPDRFAAVGLLTRFERSHESLRSLETSAFASDPAPEHQAHPASDRRHNYSVWVCNLAEGVLRHRLSLDWMLSGFMEKPPKSDALRQVLRLAVYEIVYKQPPTPPHAAVNEAVKIARRIASDREAKFVNAVLRQVKPGLQPSWPDRVKNLPGYLSARFSIPEWMVKRWIARLGSKEAEQLCREMEQPPGLALRACIDRKALVERLRREGVLTVPMQHSPDGLCVTGRLVLAESQAFREGLFTVQDESAQRVGQFVGAQPGESILDACAAPGGKLVQIAQALAGGRVVGWDVAESRLNLIRSNLNRLKISRVELKLQDARRPSPDYIGKFDRVLVDAPCSGTGVLRRQPDIRWTKNPHSIGLIAARQLDILCGAGKTVKPGGVLVYATCSLEEEENEKVVEGFLTKHPEFERVGEPLVIWPHHGHSDGAFAAKMIRRI